MSTHDKAQADVATIDALLALPPPQRNFDREAGVIDYVFAHAEQGNPPTRSSQRSTPFAAPMVAG
jgi:hypothetical protein